VIDFLAIVALFVIVICLLLLWERWSMRVNETIDIIDATYEQKYFYTLTKNVDGEIWEEWTVNDSFSLDCEDK